MHVTPLKVTITVTKFDESVQLVFQKINGNGATSWIPKWRRTGNLFTMFLLKVKWYSLDFIRFSV